jgi:tRNA pseudouridine38-40 synthase
MYNSIIGQEVYHQEKIIDWNVRYSAKSRTYIYRIMYSRNVSDWGIPFEWDRSWRINDNHHAMNATQPQSKINIEDMRLAASYLIGTHDFSSFRAAGCQRQIPIMTISDIKIHIEPYATYERLLMHGSLPTTNTTMSVPYSSSEIQHDTMMNGECYIITIRYVGDAFLYRQVRKMTACLVAVGRGKMTPSAVRDILLQKHPGGVPYTAPPQGLYLVNVEHEGILI